MIAGDCVLPVDRLCVHQRISEIPRDQWNALIADNNPFIRHEWLQALEDHQCVGAHFGWLPRHLAVYRQDRLMAAMPLYEKTNSYGEFVFDHAWAQAWQRAGLDYYPKLVVGSPYTPAAGQRLLTPVAEAEYWYRLLCDGARQLAGQLRASGVHWLFPGDREHDWLVGQGFLARHDCQFHWHNRGYRTFDDFLLQPGLS